MGPRWPFQASSGNRSGNEECVRVACWGCTRFFPGPTGKPSRAGGLSQTTLASFQAQRQRERLERQSCSISKASRLARWKAAREAAAGDSLPDWLREQVATQGNNWAERGVAGQGTWASGILNKVKVQFGTALYYQFKSHPSSQGSCHPCRKRPGLPQGTFAFEGSKCLAPRQPGLTAHPSIQKSHTDYAPLLPISEHLLACGGKKNLTQLFVLLPALGGIPEYAE